MAKQIDLETMRHSAAHVLAMAVQQMFPEAKLGIGPTIADGFYYDFELPRTLIPEDLPILEEKMRKIIKDNLPFIKKEEEAKKSLVFCEKIGQRYKAELIKELPGKTVTFYETGHFVDLCRGPHVKKTGEIGPFKLLKIAGAYWRGNENQPMLQRIYGTAFETQKELDTYLEKIAKAEENDHRKFGKSMDLFHLDDQFGAGMPLWHPAGARLKQTIEDYWKNLHQQLGYELVSTPHLARKSLWQTSGHTDFYRENMFPELKLDNSAYIVKPMNCPGHMLIFANEMRSYRELPIRLAELGMVYRLERSGVLHGLTRVRSITIDDGHIFCRPDQVKSEIKKIIDLAIKVYQDFGFADYQAYLSTKPAKAIGKATDWQSAEKELKEALVSAKIKYIEDPGEGVFYGPKIDIKVKDALDREWQLTTIQFDFNLPERFDLSYIDEKGKKQRPILIHRAILGSIERFIGVLLEHYAGKLPVWLAPTQVMVLPVSEKLFDYSCDIFDQLKKAGLRADCDMSNESLGRKIRLAEMKKIPYMIIIGEKEKTAKKVAVRDRSGDQGQMELLKLIGQIQKEIEKKN